jgi:ABC-type Fe3+ transport system permease subunit
MEAVVFIALFATILALAYIYYTTRNKERLALIEKGADASLFNTGKMTRPNGGWSWSLFILKSGMFLMGIAVGIIIGGLLTSLGVLDEGTNYTSMIFFFGGLSLVLSYLVKAKVERQ